MSGLTVCLWFDKKAEEAANYYVSIFRDVGRPAAIDGLVRFNHSHQQEGVDVVAVNFTLDGQSMLALNGGPEFTPTPATSLVLKCKDQAELDAFWNRLVDGGSPMECSWLTDKYGFAWQIVPEFMLDILQNGTPEVRQRVADAMMTMVKLDIATLEAARDAT
ncbi:VOC family protein [Brucella thiophenivorans]|uniref:3-demethylubiquinone-9 3-methyltransferase family protein n=1 Tax=Brucella thiophenivorans TaxID=571255 RepID=A0A256FWI0_9HYPH|nr:VOC family protein [Brucella thiophenivorans]OYR18791.1 3-demethylubiquinone-9 3-methyltransferase family protein [Brucella thiophenivorans]